MKILAGALTFVGGGWIGSSMGYIGIIPIMLIMTGCFIGWVVSAKV